MPAMRYQNRQLLEHLASAYIVNSLSPRVHQRVTSLRSQLPGLDHLILKWQQDFSTLEVRENVTHPSASVWQAINKRTSSIKKHKTKKSFSNNWLGYIWTSFAAIYAVVLVGMWFDVPTHVSLTPSYMAVLSNEQEQTQLIAVSYKGTEEKSPSLKFQQIDTKKFKVEDDLHVWTVAKNTGEYTYIGAFNRKGIDLSSPQWKAIKNAEKVEVTAETGTLGTKPNGKIILSGRCWQLESWKET